MKNTIVFLTLISFLVSGYRLVAKTPVDTVSEKEMIHQTKKKRGLISKILGCHLALQRKDIK